MVRYGAVRSGKVGKSINLGPVRFGEARWGVAGYGWAGYGREQESIWAGRGGVWRGRVRSGVVR